MSFCLPLLSLYKDISSVQLMLLTLSISIAPSTMSDDAHTRIGVLAFDACVNVPLWALEFTSLHPSVMDECK